MHALFFGAKRAYYATLKVARPVLARFGLTPARLDLMTVITKGGGHRVWQSEIRKALGVAAATVSRMVRALEELGFVERKRSAYERRQIEVSLTDEGRARVSAVQDEVIDAGYIELAADSALGEERWHDGDYCFEQMDGADWAFRRLRHCFGDRATLYHPWHPDD